MNSTRLSFLLVATSVAAGCSFSFDQINADVPIYSGPRYPLRAGFRVVDASIPMRLDRIGCGYFNYWPNPFPYGQVLEKTAAGALSQLFEEFEEVKPDGTYDLVIEVRLDSMSYKPACGLASLEDNFRAIGSMRVLSQQGRLLWDSVNNEARQEAVEGGVHSNHPKVYARAITGALKLLVSNWVDSLRRNVATGDLGVEMRRKRHPSVSQPALLPPRPSPITGPEPTQRTRKEVAESVAEQQAPAVSASPVPVPPGVAPPAGLRQELEGANKEVSKVEAEQQALAVSADQVKTGMDSENTQGPSAGDPILKLTKTAKRCALTTTPEDARRMERDLDFKKDPRECRGKGIALSVPIIKHHGDGMITMCDGPAAGHRLTSGIPGADALYQVSFRVRNTSKTKAINIDLSNFYLVMRDPGVSPPSEKSVEVAGFLEKATRRNLCQEDPVSLDPEYETYIGILYLASKHVPWLLVDFEHGIVVDISHAYVWEMRESCGRDHGHGKRVSPNVVDESNPVGPGDRPPIPAGVYYGSGHFVDRQAGEGCTVTDDKQLTISVEADSTASWMGFSELRMTCPGQSIDPTRCKHEGSGAVRIERGAPILALATTGSQGITLSGLDRHVWDCRGATITVPTGFEPGPDCLDHGPADADPREKRVAGFLCGATKEWTELEHARVTVRGNTIVVPVAGKKRLVLKRVGELKERH